MCDKYIELIVITMHEEHKVYDRYNNDVCIWYRLSKIPVCLDAGYHEVTEEVSETRMV